MLRKSVAILAVFLSFIATEAVALGLGRVSVESSLNQPLRVRIEVLQLGDTRLEDVNIQLASPEDFLRFNIERTAFLNNIRFDSEASPQGNFVILTTNQIVREPYLSFILETRWTNGRLLSEHTILLDLPVYEDEAVPEAAVRRPIRSVLTPQSSPQVAEPTANTPTSSAPSVQPVIQPEVIAPSNVEETAVEESVTTDSSSQAAESMEDEPTALTQNTADESDAQEDPIEEAVVEADVAEETIVEETQIEEQPVDDSTDDAEPAAELDELSDDTNDNNSEELTAEPVVDDLLSEPAEDSVIDEPADAEPETITTSSADTLSDIALRIRPDDSVSIQQTMLAIQELNPDAFTDGNINRLRSGEVLRVPSITDIQAIGQRDAVAEVSRQNQQATTDVQPLAAPSSTVPAQDEQASGQLSVITSDVDADSSGAGVSEDADDNALDGRIAELENQLALREEEADRARIEKEELESRLAELDEQIAAAQEIIRLRDLQLAQLQQSLADAAAEAALQAQQQSVAPAPIPTEVTATETQPTGFVDSLLRTLMSNSILLIAAVVIVILLLAGFLVMRNKAKQPDEEDLDSIEEGEFKGVTDAKDVEDDDGSDAAMASEFHDYEEAELDSELDDIISVGGQTPRNSSGISVDSVLDIDQDIASEVDQLIEHGQLEQADLLLAQALRQNPDDTQLLLKKLEVVAAQGDLSAFEMQAEFLHNENNPAIDDKINSLRDELATNTIVDKPVVDDAVSDAETQRQKAETASFLDDLGIDLDSFEDDAFHLADDPIEETPLSKPLEVSLDEMPPETEPEAVDLMFDLAAEPDPVVSEPVLEEPADDEEPAQGNEIEFGVEEADEAEEVSQPELMTETAADEVDFETLEFDQGANSELAESGSTEPENLEIDTLEFDVAEPAQEEPELAKPEQELDLETFSFDPPPAPVPTDVPASDVENREDDDGALDFDFDPADIKVEPEVDVVVDPETFDFDLDDDSTATIVEKSAGADDEISLDFGDLEEADDADSASEEASVASSVPSAAIEDDFDFDLNELEIDADDIDVSDVEIELTDDDFLDLDSEIGIEADGNAASDKSAAKPSSDLNLADDDVAFGFDDEFEVSEIKADTVVESATAGDDLEFLSEDDIAFDGPDFEGDPESLSDEDETATKLELAYAYQKMGDSEGAQEILREVISEGTEAQIKEAQDLIETLSSNSD